MFFKNITNRDEYLKKLLIIISWMIILVGAIYILNVFKPVIIFILKSLMPFIIALILAYVFDPIVTFFQKRLKLPRFTGLIVFYILVLIIIAAFLLLILPEVFKQSVSLIDSIKTSLPDKLEKLKDKYNIPITKEEIKEFIDKFNITKEKIKKAAELITPQISNVASSGVSAAGNIVKGIASGIGQIFSLFSIIAFIVIINFYFLMDFSKIKPTFEKVLPNEHAPKILDMMKKIDIAVGGFLRGQAIDCLIIGILTTIGLLIMGFRQYAILIGVITSIGNAIPYLGPIMGGIPSIAWILLSDSYSGAKEKLIGAGILVVLFAVIQTIDGLILQPKIVGKNSQLHPLAVLLALFVGAQFGLSGMIIAVPAACIIRVLFIELVWEKLTENKNNKNLN